MKPTLIALAVLALSLPARADDASSAKDDFEAKCQKCHGASGKGDTKMGKKLHAADFTKARWQKKTDDDEIKKAITEGIVEKGKRVMPAFKEKLTAEQIDALVGYVRAFGKPAEEPKK